MNYRTMILLLGTAMSLSLAVGVNAREIQVQTGRVNINRSQDGDLHINTGRMQIDVPKVRSPFQKNSLINSSRYTPRGCHRSNVVRQYSRQSSRSGRTNSHTSMHHYQCR